MDAAYLLDEMFAVPELRQTAQELSELARSPRRFIGGAGEKRGQRIENGGWRLKRRRNCVVIAPSFLPILPDETVPPDMLGSCVLALDHARWLGELFQRERRAGALPDLVCRQRMEPESLGNICFHG